jgi:uncharacterized protein involved in type VI secretion and phage assembly
VRLEDETDEEFAQRLAHEEKMFECENLEVKDEDDEAS